MLDADRRSIPSVVDRSNTFAVADRPTTSSDRVPRSFDESRSDLRTHWSTLDLQTIGGCDVAEDECSADCECCWSHWRQRHRAEWFLWGTLTRCISCGHRDQHWDVWRWSIVCEATKGERTASRKRVSYWCDSPRRISVTERMTTTCITWTVEWRIGEVTEREIERSRLALPSIVLGSDWSEGSASLVFIHHPVVQRPLRIWSWRVDEKWLETLHWWLIHAVVTRTVTQRARSLTKIDISKYVDRFHWIRAWTAPLSLENRQLRTRFFQWFLRQFQRSLALSRKTLRDSERWGCGSLESVEKTNQCLRLHGGRVRSPFPSLPIDILHCSERTMKNRSVDVDAGGKLEETVSSSLVHLMDLSLSAFSSDVDRHVQQWFADHRPIASRRSIGNSSLSFPSPSLSFSSSLL